MTPKLPLALIALFAFSWGQSIAAPPPNIVVFLADDAGWADFGFQGGGITNDFAALTPNLDSLAANGVKFSNGYVSGPVCCPSRAGLMTGRYQQRFGMEQNIQSEPNAGLPATEKTIANTLKALGYRTYALGKWHLGEDLPEHHPNQRGFDEYFGHLSGARTYFQFTGVSDASKLQSNGVFVAESPTQYLTDVLGDAAVDFIGSHVTNFPSQPFLLYLAFNGVHTPLEADAARLADPRIQSITNTNRKTLAAMTIAVDDAVGAVMNKLNQLGLATNTLAVFLSDNGGPEDNLSLNAPNWSDNGPLRGNKTLLYEGGIRVPFLMNWPGTIPSAPGGRVIDDPVISLDLLPTFVAAAGGSLFPNIATDGVNLLPRVTDLVTNRIERCLFWRTGGSTGGQSAVRKGDWKLYRDDNAGVVELYNLASDIGEASNLAAAHPDKVTELIAAHAEWERGMIEPLWGGGAPAMSSSSLIYRASGLGLELEKTDTGYAYILSERRAPLSLNNDWSLAWSMESVAVPGYARNGFIVLGDALSTANLIRIGVSFGTGTMSITETFTNAASTLVIGSVAAGVTNDFRVDYLAATRTLTLRFGANVVSHTLTGTYGDLDYSGCAIQSDCRTRFSPLNLYAQPVAAGTTPTWARMKVAKDYFPGTYDTNGNFLGGTEGMNLVTHKGRLFAGIGYWNDVFFGGGTNDPHPGPQVLVKEAWNAPWKQDVAFGSNHLRIECLRSLTITTDKNGVPLNPPVTLLLAGSGELTGSPRRATVFVRNDTNGVWTATYPGTTQAGSATTRMIFDHVDRSLPAPVHYVFCGYGGADNTLVRGGYNAVTGLIDWEPVAELSGNERMLSAGECNGVLYACIGSDDNLTNNIGGIFWREDGPVPNWHFVYEWPTNSRNPDIRGFTAVPHPKGFGYDVALVTLESFGKVYCIDPVGGDPRNGHIVTEELNIQTFLGDEWNGGVSIGFPTLSAYNDMPEVIHPGTGQPVNLIGLGVGYPAPDNTPERNSAYYLIRHRNATYEWGRVFDPAVPLPNPTAGGLRATRAARLSPFPEDAGRVLYFSGFDAASQTGPVWHNTAWIYRAELPDEASQIQRTGADFTLSIDTAATWQYQLQHTPDFTQWFDLGALLNGNNASQSQLVTPALGAQQQFYRWGIKRP